MWSAAAMPPHSTSPSAQAHICVGGVGPLRTAAPGTVSADDGAALAQKLPQDRAVAVALVRAIAADGKVRLPRQRGEETDEPRVLRLRHFGAVLARESRPRG